jgi:hypothetical protein
MGKQQPKEKSQLSLIRSCEGGVGVNENDDDE